MTDLEKQLAEVDIKIATLREGLKKCEEQTELLRTKIAGLEATRAKVAEMLGRQPA
jgi:chromosome segregation ATPase